MQATARRLSVVSATSWARRRLIRNVRLTSRAPHHASIASIRDSRRLASTHDRSSRSTGGWGRVAGSCPRVTQRGFSFAGLSFVSAPRLGCWLGTVRLAIWARCLSSSIPSHRDGLCVWLSYPQRHSQTPQHSCDPEQPIMTQHEQHQE